MTRALLCLLPACAFGAPTPQAAVRHGPAFGQVTGTLAALPVECERATMGCLPGYVASVASATRIALEFGGYTIVDGELINAELRRRTSTTLATAQPPPAPRHPGDMPPEDEATTTELTGATWLDLPPGAQRDLLAAMGIDGVLRATVAMTTPGPWSAMRTVTVEIAVTRLSDGQLAWQSRCHVPTGHHNSEPQAIELATRCALESGMLW